MDVAQVTRIHTGQTVSAFGQALAENLHFLQGTSVESANLYDRYMTLYYTVRNHLMKRWRETAQTYYETNPKFVYYLSAEYLLGRQLQQNLLHIDTSDLARQALADHKVDLDQLIELDIEPAFSGRG